MTFSILYFFNLLEAEARRLNGESNKWEDADLDAILAGNGTDVEKTCDRLYKAAKHETIRDLCYEAQIYIDARNSAAHDAVDCANIKRIDEMVEKLESVAKAKTGKNFESVEELAVADQMCRRALTATGREACANTLGRCVVNLQRQPEVVKYRDAHIGKRGKLEWFDCERPGCLRKSDARWMWRLNNLRNRVIHTGHALTKSERSFLASIPARVEKLLQREARYTEHWTHDWVFGGEFGA